MEIRTLESVGIQTVESGIKTAKQKITTTEERAEEALLNSTMAFNHFSSFSLHFS